MCIGPRATDANLWILIWEELHRVHQEGLLVEVEHVKRHRSKKDVQQMSLFFRRRYGWSESYHDSAGTEERFLQHCNMKLASTVWWKNGKIVKSLDQSQMNSLLFL